MSLFAKMVRGFGALAVAAAFGLSSTPVQAVTPDDLKAKGEIVIGVLVDFPPFGMMDDKREPAGYDIDVAKLVAEELGVEAKIQAISNANRIPYLQSGQVDLLVASLGNTPERAEQVLFTNPYAATSVVVAGKEGLDLTEVSGMEGMRIAVGRGGSPETWFTKNPVPGATMLKFDGEAGAFQAVMSGQADVFSSANIMVNNLIKTYPQAGIDTKLTLATQRNCIAVKKDSTELQAWVNDFLAAKVADGTLDALYQKWVGGPLPDLS